MKNNAVVKLTATQMCDDEEPEVIEYLTEGLLEKRPDGLAVLFDEPAEGIKDVKNELVIINPEYVTLTRSGEFGTHLLIEKGKRHTSVYETPYGSVLIGVFADDVSAMFSEKGGTVKMSYTVDSSSAVLTQNTVTVEIKNI